MFSKLALVMLPCLAVGFQAPAGQKLSVAASAKSTSLPFMEAPEALDGSMAGDVGFDPLGLSSIIDIKWMREAELKHGRICQLAWLGFVFTDLGFTLPGDMHKVSSVAAHDAAIQYGAMQQLLLFISLAEIISSVAVSQMMTGESDRKPGDFSLDFFKFSSTPEKAAEYELKEIVHCRAAMLAFSGVVTQAVLTGKGFPYF